MDCMHIFLNCNILTGLRDEQVLNFKIYKGTAHVVDILVERQYFLLQQTRDDVINNLFKLIKWCVDLVLFNK